MDLSHLLPQHRSGFAQSVTAAMGLGSVMTSTFVEGLPDWVDLAGLLVGLALLAYACVGLSILVFFRWRPKQKPLRAATEELYASVVSGPLGDGARRLSTGGPLFWFCYYAQSKVPIYGRRRDSSVLEAIPSSNLHFVERDNQIIGAETLGKEEWRDLQIRRGDLKKLAASIKVLNDDFAPEKM